MAKARVGVGAGADDSSDEEDGDEDEEVANRLAAAQNPRFVQQRANKPREGFSLLQSAPSAYDDVPVFTPPGF